MSESRSPGPEADRSSEVAMALDRVSVCYKVSGDRRKVTAGKLLSNLIRGRSSRRDVWALQDVSLALRRGETLGLVGPNGAGKSTLLKVVARVIRPKRGRVLVGGLVAPLIELGAGFNGELTGRENLYLKAAMHGLTCRQIRKRADSIIDFSGLDDFIDAPLRTYSTGMMARLAFSVAIDTRPDVLLVDEVLGVGDTDFQHRCQVRVEELRRSGTAVILVSHGLQLIRTWCDRAAWLSYGRLQMSGSAADVVDAYEGVIGAAAQAATMADREHRPGSLRVLMDGVIDGSGWYSKELNPRLGPYRWTGPQSRATLRLPSPGDLARGDALLRFHIIVLVSPNVLERLRVTLNGRAVPLMESRLEDGSRIMEGLVPRGTVDAGGAIEVTFDVGETESPNCSSLGYVDSRMLGIAVGWVEFTALGTEQWAHQSDGADSVAPSRGRAVTVQARSESPEPPVGAALLRPVVKGAAGTMAKPLWRRTVGVLGRIRQRLDESLFRPRLLERTTRSLCCAARRVAGVEAPHGITVIGYFNAASGVAEVARQSALTLRRLGVPVSYVSVPTEQHEEEDRLSEHIPYGVSHGINLLHVNADCMRSVVERIGPRWLTGKRNVGVWFWEMPVFPAEWSDRFDWLDELWVASRYTRVAITPRSPIPVHHFRPVVRPATPEAGQRTRLGVPESKFMFLFAFDLLSIIERKNPFAVIQAFRMAFGRCSRDAVLVVKTNHLQVARRHRMQVGLTPETEDRLAREVDSVSGVLITDTLRRREVHSLIADCDCYVSLHRSEGFGLTLLEAMYFGRPCIATGWSGNMDFMTAANSYLVNYKLVQLDADAGPYRAGWTWAEPDVEHAAELMRRIYDTREEAVERGALAATQIRADYGLETAGTEMLRMFERLAGQPLGSAGSRPMRSAGGEP